MFTNENESDRRSRIWQQWSKKSEGKENERLLTSHLKKAHQFLKKKKKGLKGDR